MSMEAGAITLRTVATLAIATWPRRLLLGGLLIIPVLIGVLGGFQAAEPEVRQVEPGTVVDLGPLSVRPTAYFVSEETLRSELGYTDGAVAWLGVIAEVDNLTDTGIPLTFTGNASGAVVPVLPDGAIASTSVSTADESVLLADGNSVWEAIPGVPIEVVLLWPITDAAAVGESLDITMTEQYWTYRFLAGEEGWLPSDDVWTMTLPQVPLPDQFYEPPEDQ